MNTPGFSVRLSVDGNSACIGAAGELDLATVERLRASVAAALSDGRVGGLMIDLADVTFCDSCGLQALFRAQQLCEQRGIPLILFEPGPRVRRVIEIAGLEDRFTIKPETVDKDALRP